MKLVNFCMAFILIFAMFSCGESTKKNAENAPDTTAINKVSNGYTTLFRCYSARFRQINYEY